jgi:dTDP-4-dehydrorhamnose reductase
MRIAILGAEGQVGTALAEAFDGHDVTALSRSDCDVTDRDAVYATMFAVGPQLVCNAAAMTAVDACESESDRAFAVNAFGARTVAAAAHAVDAELVHFSTDYVFDGAAGRPYDEWDEPNPLSVYGRSKLGGEREVRQHCPRSYVVRTSVVFSSLAPNFALAILDAAAESADPLQVVGDQIGSPTYAPHLADAVRRLAVSGRHGMYHLAGSGACSRAEMARELLSGSGDDPDRVIEVTTDVVAAAYPAPRPACSALDARAWRLAGGTALPDWRLGVRALLEEIGATPSFVGAVDAAAATEPMGDT